MLAATHSVNETVAREVADVFLESDSDPRDGLVGAAYRQLAEQSDQALAAVTCRHGMRVVFSRCRVPYASDEEMIAAVRECRVLEVTVASAEPDRLHPILACDPGGAYDRFRALHDLIGHVLPGFGFDRDGEYAAWLRQERLHTGLARQALATELHGEHSVRWTTGEPSDHKALLLDGRLIERARRADP